MPLPFLTINTVGKTIMEFGSEEQKAKFLPKILAGECHFSIGYTEPGAGTDLASLRTTAVQDGDEWVINGQKVYTSLASYADYIWLAARTDPDAPKHKGITIFLVPTSDPGFSWTKIHTMVNASTTSTYYNDVRVGDDAVVSAVNRGWDLITNQLNYERMSLGASGHGRALLRRRGRVGAGHEARPTAGASSTRSGCRSTWPGCGRRPSTSSSSTGRCAPARSTPGSPARPRCSAPSSSPRRTACCSRWSARGGQLRRGSPEAALAGRIERAMQGTLILTFGGGTNEVQRDLIALFGLGLPRVPRRLRDTLHGFRASEEQQAIAELAGRILTEKLPPERLREIETDPAGRWFADDVWNELAKADLLGVCLPESVGGGGYGFLEACLLLEQQGRAVAPLPLVPTLVLGALPIARFGSPSSSGAAAPA